MYRARLCCALTPVAALNQGGRTHSAERLNEIKGLVLRCQGGSALRWTFDRNLLQVTCRKSGFFGVEQNMIS